MKWTPIIFQHFSTAHFQIGRLIASMYDRSVREIMRKFERPKGEIQCSWHTSWSSNCVSGVMVPGLASMVVMYAPCSWPTTTVSECRCWRHIVLQSSTRKSGFCSDSRVYSREDEASVFTILCWVVLCCHCSIKEPDIKEEKKTKSYRESKIRTKCTPDIFWETV